MADDLPDMLIVNLSGLHCYKTPLNVHVDFTLMFESSLPSLQYFTVVRHMHLWHGFTLPCNILHCSFGLLFSESMISSQTVLMAQKGW